MSNTNNQKLITKTLVDSLIPGDKIAVAWDGGKGAVKGFGIRVSPGGTKSYFYQYRTAEGRVSRYNIGRHGRVTAEQARKIARETASQVNGAVNYQLRANVG
jgi:hypothetical protein